MSSETKQAHLETELDTRFDHRAVAEKWYDRWEKAGAFQADPASSKPPFTMVIPPPNVTGALHMGHALNNTIQDIYARWHRMKGFDVLWLPGTDHAGIATQNVVEKQLAAEGSSRDAIGREAFVERVWKWKAESGGTIVRQLRRLGATCDWTRERFTMDEGLSAAVLEVFVRLHEDGLIYRADRLVNWCTRCHTALSDIEVEHEERNGSFWHVRYLFADGSGEVIIATTRPETMLGDTAVAVHPEDERYAGLIGKELILPLVGRRIPLIADPYVDKTFGTGAVKITPAHDPNDWEVGLRHKLPVIKAFTGTGVIAPEAAEGAAADAAVHGYIGQKIVRCRDSVVRDLEAQGFLVKVDEHKHNVGHCYRCKTVIEPFLTPQWFVKVGPLAEPAIAAVESGKTRIIPKQWEKTYFEWMRNIRDWCISRQIWWGHRIPAWYRADGTPFVARTEAEARAKAGIGPDEPFPRDPDVLDTWFSSALWPFSTLGWPEETAEVKRYYPTSLLVTGFDILFFWVARMMMAGLKFRGEIPFHDVYIHALVRDAEGKKMSKSRGNVIDPLSVIDDLGADAFRFTLAAFAAQGRDIKLDEKRIEGYRNFVTKIWNAARLVLSASPQAPVAPPASERPAEDRWILTRLGRATAAVTRALETYELDKAADAIYTFFWREYCDWYLEIVKPRFRGGSAGKGDAAALATAREVLASSLKIMHPFMPFVTDELHERMGGEGFLDHAPFPAAAFVDPEAEAKVERLVAVVTEIRRLRAELAVPASAKLTAHLVGEPGLEPFRVALETMAGLATADFASARPSIKHFAAGVAGGSEILLPLEGIVDLEKEKQRLGDEIARAEKQIASSRARLEDPSFASNAPPEIVAASRATLADREEHRARLIALREHL